MDRLEIDERPIVLDATTAPPLRRRAPENDDDIPAFVNREMASLGLTLLPNRSRGYLISKRIIDLVIAVPVLLVSLPVIGVIAVFIRLGSPGPAIFRQRRTGTDGRLFTFYKFRTMYVDAKDRFPELYDYDFDSSEVSTRHYKLTDDPRNTRFGALIRKTSLDELPNLFSVVKGDVSLVGPRPELPGMVQHYKPHQMVKFKVKPGLTGLAVCTGRNTLTIEDQIRADVEYVARQSLRLDLTILRDTVKMILRREGAE